MRVCVFFFFPSVYCDQMSAFPLKTGFFPFDFLPGFICPAQFDTAPAKNKTKCEFQGQQIRELESGTVQGCSPPAGLSCGGPAITKGSAATPLDGVVKEVACRNLFCTIMCCVVNLCPCFWMTEPFNDASFIPYHDNSACSQRPLLPVALEHSMYLLTPLSNPACHIKFRGRRYQKGNDCLCFIYVLNSNWVN